MDMFRETAAGQLIRFVTRNKLLQYPEEKDGFSWAPLVCPIRDIPYHRNH